jgi:UDP-2-acetamido-2-deoxy-ribo-hexuluronate aminotransferase
MLPIKMVDLGASHRKYYDEIELAIHQVIESEIFIGGQIVNEFADKFATFNKVAHVIPCGNGTDALQIAFMALGFKSGDEIIVPAFTFVATAEAAAILGVKPVFVDVDPVMFTIDPEQIEAQITEKTVGIVAVNLFGQNTDIESIMVIAERHNLYVIEDAAQSVGSDYQFSDGRLQKSGTVGHIGTISFFPSKNLGAYGDGGAVLTNNEELAIKCQQIANHGHSVKYFSKRIGMNSRLDPIQASILQVKLKYLNDFNRARQEIAQRYTNGLAGINGIELPATSPWTSHVFHQYTLKVDPELRDDLKAYLDQVNIPAMIYYPHPLHLQEAYQNERHGDLSNSELLSKSVLSIPMHPELSEEQQAYIVDHIKKFMSNPNQ